LFFGFWPFLFLSFGRNNHSLALFTRNILVRIVQQALQFLITLAIARLTGPEGNGIFSIFITDVSFFILFLGLCADSSIVYFAAKGRIGLSDIISLLLPLILIQAVVLLAAYAGSIIIFHHHFFRINIDQPGLGWAFLFIFSSIIYNYFTAFLSAKKVFFEIIVYNIVVQLLFLLIVLFQHYAKTGFLSIDRLIALYSCIFLVNGIIAAILAFRYSGEKLVLKNPFKIGDKIILKYLAVAYVANILQFLAYRMDIWLMGHYQPKKEVGIYALAAKIAQLWWILPQFIALLLFPLTALEDSSIDGKKFRQCIIYTIAGSIVTALIAVIVYPLFIEKTAGVAFLLSYQPFLYLLPGVLLFTVNILLAARLAGKGNVIVNMQASAFCFIIILGLDLWLIPLKSGTGAAIASSIGYSAATIFTIFKYKKWSNA
jgi:O-antigen/teichoic acid export membrane protein